jgi:hypothetical protein
MFWCVHRPGPALLLKFSRAKSFSHPGQISADKKVLRQQRNEQAGESFSQSSNLFLPTKKFCANQELIGRGKFFPGVQVFSLGS